MLIHEMIKDECRAELGRTDFGRLACVRDADLYIVPVNFLCLVDTKRYRTRRNVNLYARTPTKSCS
jgi:nitroimidazol reductase NimA-like FMN-containing flavoprotein (pyridoxamine 5'-phosphate oxidase superfamily)